jgi:hypothetical protein
VFRQWGVRRSRFKLVVMLVALSLPPARADQGPAGKKIETRKVCYCGCDSESGAPMCMKMCEVPQYQNRSWATSCRRKPVNVAPHVTPSPAIHSRKRNRIEDARLHAER